jgi:hypothetical protein
MIYSTHLETFSLLPPLPILIDELEPVRQVGVHYIELAQRNCDAQCRITERRLRPTENPGSAVGQVLVEHGRSGEGLFAAMLAPLRVGGELEFGTEALVLRRFEHWTRTRR